MRIELIHPMLVHFPLALLLIGAALRFIFFFAGRKRFARYILVSSWILLFLGVCFAWITAIAGEFAEDIVSGKLCNPEVLENHMHLAYTAASLFSIALILDWGKQLAKKLHYPSNLIKLLTIVYFLLYLSAVIILIFVGKFGGNLVYDQGAAVENRCK